MRIRQIVLQIHLWLGLAFAAVILVASVTGTALVYRHEIDRALNPALYRTTAGDIGWDAVWQAAKARYPSIDTALIRGPVDRGVYQIEFGEGRLPFSVHVDPGTGQILGARDPERSLAGWLFLLHFDLVGGDFGHQIVGAAGVALVIVTLTGIWLWWPSIRRLASGFRIRWSRPFFIVNYDLHRVLGIFSLPLVLVIALTGTLLVFYEFGSRLVHAALFTAPAAATPLPSRAFTSDSAGPARVLSLNEAAAVAVRLAPNAQASSMYVFGPGEREVKVWLRTPGDRRPNVGSWHAWIDRATGTVVSAMLPQNTSLAAHVDETWIIALHYGTFGGAPVKWLYVLAGLMPVVLLVTGTTHWLLRRRLANQRTQLSSSPDLTTSESSSS